MRLIQSIEKALTPITANTPIGTPATVASPSESLAKPDLQISGIESSHETEKPHESIGYVNSERSVDAARNVGQESGRIKDDFESSMHSPMLSNYSRFDLGATVGA